MDPSRESQFLAGKLNSAWARKVTLAREFNESNPQPTWLRRAWWSVRSFGQADLKEEYLVRWRKSSFKRPSLVWALNDALGRQFWFSGISVTYPHARAQVLIHSYLGAFKIVGDIAQLMGPLVSKQSE